MTQPQGHSTSGSHERYKSKERLRVGDRVRLHPQDARLDDRRRASPAARSSTRSRGKTCRPCARRSAARGTRIARRSTPRCKTLLALSTSWPRSSKRDELDANESCSADAGAVLAATAMRALHQALIAGARREAGRARERIAAWRREQERVNLRVTTTHLYSEGAEVGARTSKRSRRSTPTTRRCSTASRSSTTASTPRLRRDPRIIIFGEDVGKLGDVNQGCAGLQEKYGVCCASSDTGIRETTIIGQAIGAAMRGLRPIAEIQYLDYVLYALQILSDDLATLRWRTRRRAEVPGHHPHARPSPRRHLALRLADGGILHLVRGMYVCVPRNMTQAAGMYNTLLRGDDPAIVVEVLNGYRIKEKLPRNIADFTLPLGVPEVLREGKDVTLVSYGATLRIVIEAAELLAHVGHRRRGDRRADAAAVRPARRDRRVAEEDATASRSSTKTCPAARPRTCMQQVLERDHGYGGSTPAADASTAKDHRPPYGSDGDYLSKPSREEIFAAVRELVSE